MLKKGLIQVYTGDGKGKTTAGFGQALRAVGRGLNVCIFQFLKNEDLNSGEIIASEKFKENLKIIRSRQIHPFFTGGREKSGFKKEVNKMIHRIKNVIAKNEYDIVILDEINNCIDSGLLKVKEVLNILNKKPQNMELILTGRNAPLEIIEKADLVTNMSLIKHPYKEGIKARLGIEY